MLQGRSKKERNLPDDLSPVSEARDFIVLPVLLQQKEPQNNVTTIFLIRVRRLKTGHVRPKSQPARANQRGRRFLNASRRSSIPRLDGRDLACHSRYFAHVEIQKQCPDHVYEAAKRFVPPQSR